MRKVVCVAVALVSLVPASSATSAGSRARDVAYRDCFVQEIRGPMPARVFTNSMPPEWEPVPYGGAGALATHGGTILSCRWKKAEITETWWWVQTVPPKKYRDRSVDAYAFLLVGVASPEVTFDRTARSCIDGWMDRGETTIEEVASFPRSIHSVVHWDSGVTDEAYIEVDQRAPLPANRMRLFFSLGDGPGYTEGAPIHSFDVIYDAEDGQVGPAVFGQRVGEPSLDGLVVSVPGFWAGEAIASEGNAFITAGGKASCRP